MKLFAKVVVRRDWNSTTTYNLGRIYIDRLPDAIREVLGRYEVDNALLIQIELWNEEMRERKKEEE